MEIFVLGLNHKTAPLDLRERLSIPTHKAQGVLKRLDEKNVFQERLLLSTCNRTEIYGVTRNGNGIASDSPNHAIQQTKEFLSQYADLNLSAFEDKLYVLKQPDSVEHLFSVASGLDSMVLGETEIIGQVKDAYRLAHENQQTGKVLNALFQRSLKVAKNLRTQTEIGVGRVSVASVSVDLAEKIFENLKAVRVLVLGTGQVASQVSKAIISKGAFPLIVSKCHWDRAESLVHELGGEAVPYENYEKRMKQVDILIASTSAPHAIIAESQVKAWMKARHDKPLFLIDIAVPRNIESTVEKLDNVYLYNIDDLHGIADKNKSARQGQLEECQRLVKNQTRYFMDWLLTVC